MYIYLGFLLSITCVAGTENKKWEASVLREQLGHYPYKQCKITNVMLIPDELQEKGIFYTQNDIELSTCAYTPSIWHFGVDSELDSSWCDVTFDVGHVVLIFYLTGASNYYHLHWDTAIPLYKALYYGKDVQHNMTVAVLPSVETKRLQEINWKTNAFVDKYKDKYWNEIIRLIIGTHTYLPLDEDLLQQNQTLCFKELYFGTTNWHRDEKDMIQQFVRHAMINNDIPQTPPTEDRIGIISRHNRRRILNENELVAELEKIAPTDLILYDGLTYKQQVELMQKYTVVAGMNGAGLMNCIYLPPTSTCVQLVPYGAKTHLNFEDYGKLLKLRGPYAEWHNRHEEMNVVNQGPHTSDTTVHITELVKVIKEAMEFAKIAREKLEKSDDFISPRVPSDDEKLNKIDSKVEL